MTWKTGSIRLFLVLLLLGDSTVSDTLPLHLDSLLPPSDLWQCRLLGVLFPEDSLRLLFFHPPIPATVQVLSCDFFSFSSHCSSPSLYHLCTTLGGLTHLDAYNSCLYAAQPKPLISSPNLTSTFQPIRVVACGASHGCPTDNSHSTYLKLNSSSHPASVKPALPSPLIYNTNIPSVTHAGNQGIKPCSFFSLAPSPNPINRQALSVLLSHLSNHFLFSDLTTATLVQAFSIS